MPKTLPECCYPAPEASPAEHLYCAYNAAGERPGLNYQDLPCPLWGDLPDDVQAKWKGVFAFVGVLISEWAAQPARAILERG